MLVPLSPPPGLNSDDTTFAAEGRWADGNNVRFVNGRPQTIGGADLLFTIGAGIKVVNMTPFRNAAGAIRIAYGLQTKLYAGSVGVMPGDITPVGCPTGITRWSLAQFGGILLASPENGTIYEHVVNGPIATEVTQAPNSIVCMLVTPERQVLALGCNEEASGTFNGMCVRGSDIEDYTDWTTSATNNAFEHILEGDGRIVTARLIASYVAIWTSGALYLGQYLGDPGQTYRFERVEGGCGALGSQAVVVHGGFAYWLAPDMQLYRWSPGAAVTVVPCPISRDFRENIDRTMEQKTLVRALGAYDEIWIHYCDQRDAVTTTLSRYIAFSLREGAWFRGQLPRTAVLTSGELGDTFGGGGVGDPGSHLAANGLTIYVQDTGTQLADWHLESADQYVEAGRRRVMARGISPDFEYQTGNVDLTLYVRDRPQSTAVTKGPYVLTTAATKKDFRASGKLIAVKFSKSSGVTETRMRLGKPLFDVVPTGER